MLSWVAVRVRYAAETGLSVWYDGEQRVTDLPIEGWAADADWSWSLSAATTDSTEKIKR